MLFAATAKVFIANCVYDMIKRTNTDVVFMLFSLESLHLMRSYGCKGCPYDATFRAERRLDDSRLRHRSP